MVIQPALLGLPASASMRSHVLVKSVGDSISARWGNIRNTGLSAIPAAWLEIFFPSVKLGFTGSPISVSSGAVVTLAVSGVITALTPGTTYAAELRIRALDQSVVDPDAVHLFTVSMTSGAMMDFDSWYYWWAGLGGGASPEPGDSGYYLYLAAYKAYLARGIARPPAPPMGTTLKTYYGV